MHDVGMNSRDRLLTALSGGRPDRLPATTHHLMPYFLKTYMDDISEEQFFEFFQLDPIVWVSDRKPDEKAGEHWAVTDASKVGEADRCVASEQWRVETTALGGSRNRATRYDIITPVETLSMVLEETSQSVWVSERLVKEKAQIELIAKYAPGWLCDVDAINRKAEKLGGRGIVRGAVPGFEVYGQPGCWQDAAALYGIERLIMETFDDPQWVHTFLAVLMQRKLAGVASMEGAQIDLIELGGGDASSTVISPKIFSEFVVPYDKDVAAAAQRIGAKVVYHTCGGMMAILELIADMCVDAMETFTPPSLGGDAALREAKARIGDRVCMIGGLDQARFLRGCTPRETRHEVRRCFEEAGRGGGFILAPSDHFFDADVRLIRAFADEAQQCRYTD
jgi:uroporphyrinogen decarboxylase